MERCVARRAGCQAWAEDTSDGGEAEAGSGDVGGVVVRVNDAVFRCDADEPDGETGGGVFFASLDARVAAGVERY